MYIMHGRTNNVPPEKKMREIKIPDFRMSRVVDAIRALTYPNSCSLAEELEVTDRTIRRDIEQLRDRFGAPIEFSHKKNGYFLTQPDWNMPYRITSQKDMLALILGSQVLESIQGEPLSRSLTGLPMDEHVALDDIAKRFVFRNRPARQINPDRWLDLALATVDQKVCMISYYSTRRKHIENFRFYPYLMANLEGEWYLWGLLTQQPRVMRRLALAHISSVTVGPDTFQDNPDFVPADTIKNTFGRFAHAAEEKTRWVTLLFDADIDHYITEIQWHPEQEVKRMKDNRIRLRFPYVNNDDLFYWILGFGAAVEVVRPKQLREMIAEEINLMNKRYA